MRILALVIVLVLVALPVASCGGGGGGGCTPLCFSCFTATECCDFGSGAVCSAPGGPPGFCNFGTGSCGIP